jgi:hypothetical protein
MTFRLKYAALLAALLLSSCEDPGMTDRAQFHPAGRTALTPTVIDPADLPLAAKGEVYIPIYSHIYWGRSTRQTDLSATLSIRNADRENGLILLKVDYYDSLGEKIREYVDSPVELAAMATVDFVIDVDDSVGGSGANFIVEWGAREPIAEPIMESVMLGQIGSRGISFLSPGRPVKRVGATE